MAGRPRIVIASPHVEECDVLADWLAADGFEPVTRSSARAATDEMQTRAFELLIADFAFAFRGGLHTICRRRNPQTPTVVLGESDTAAQTQAESRRAIYLVRPVERAMLVCIVSMGILEGRPVRRSLRKAVNRFHAMVNGVPSYIVDVSNEGLRVEMPRGRHFSLPPYFRVKVPMIGVAVMVQRMWASTPPGNAPTEVMRCGGALAPNQPRAEQTWRAFVDTLPALGRLSSDSIEIQ